MKGLGVVVIGRNESAKLGRCLASVIASTDTLVYVDSGSNDGSSGLARAMGVDVVDLDASTPYTVARARNAGLERLRQVGPSAEFVQFVDADSEISSSWVACAATVLANTPDVAVVFGRVHERTPGKSLYNRLYEVEFDTVFAQSELCGGMGMMRIGPVQQLGGFRTTMRGFEDFDLSRRLRSAGWQVQRLDAEMAVHDAAMSSFADWCQRKVRSGYARGQERALDGASRSASIRACRSAWFWGLVLPLCAVAGTLPTRGASLLLMAAYPVQVLRVFRRTVRMSPGGASALLYAGACVLGKFPEMAGLARFHVERLGLR